MTTDSQVMRRGRMLSARGIDDYRFALVRRGYDIAAVDDLLDRVAARIYRAEREVAVLRLDRRRQEIELDAARERIHELERQLAAAQADVEEAEQHTETTRQMFDRDLRSKGARIHELERAIEQAPEQVAALAERLAEVERGAQSDHERAETLQRQLEEVSADRQRVVADIEARRAQIENERDEARALIAQQREANEQRAAEDLALGEDVAQLWQLVGSLHDSLSVRRAEDDTRIEAVDDQLAMLEAGPLKRFIRPA